MGHPAYSNQCVHRLNGHPRQCSRVILLRDIRPLLAAAKKGSAHAGKTRGTVSLTASRSPRTSAVKNSCAPSVRLDGRHAESGPDMVSLERKPVRDGNAAESAEAQSIGKEPESFVDHR